MTWKHLVFWKTGRWGEVVETGGVSTALAYEATMFIVMKLCIHVDILNLLLIPSPDSCARWSGSYRTLGWVLSADQQHSSKPGVYPKMWRHRRLHWRKIHLPGETQRKETVRYPCFTSSKIYLQERSVNISDLKCSGNLLKQSCQGHICRES